MEIDLDSSDREILVLVAKGYSSSYSIWSAMKKAAKERSLQRKVMTYRNNNKRVIKLAQLGLIEVIKPGVHTVNIHGRKDYKVTMKGIEQLAPYILAHPEVNEFIHEYMDKTGLNKQKLGEILVDNFETYLKSINGYMESINEFLNSNPSNPLRYTMIIRNPAQIGRLYSHIKEFVIRLNDSETALAMQSKQVKSTQVNPVTSSTSTNHSSKPIASPKRKR